MNQLNWSIKEKLVDNLAEHLKENSYFLIFQYAKLTAKDIFLLRKNLRKESAKMFIQKNNILNRSLKKTEIIKDANFTGPLSIVMCKDDFKALKLVAKYAEEKKIIKLIYAYLDGTCLDNDNIHKLAKLPTKDNLYVMIMQCFKMPILKLLLTIKEIQKLKQN